MNFARGAIRVFSCSFRDVIGAVASIKQMADCLRAIAFLDHSKKSQGRLTCSFFAVAVAVHVQWPWPLPPSVAAFSGRLVAVVISCPSRQEGDAVWLSFTRYPYLRWIPSGSLAPALPSVVSSPASFGVGLRAGPRGPAAPNAPSSCPLSSGHVVFLSLCFGFGDLFFSLLGGRDRHGGGTCCK